MKLIIFLVLVGFALAQYFPPWPQYNPFFNGNKPYRNLTNYYPPFPSRNFSSNGFWWQNKFPPVFRVRRSVSYYQPYYCIPDYPQCNGSHSLSLGCLSSMDRILFQQTYVRPGRWYSRRNKIISYPGASLPSSLRPNATINAIRIQDRYCNDTGGYAEIVEGGIGYKSVKIKLYSKNFGKGFNFYVMLAGR
ncbi:hypothetical protein ILUMI_09393 [Ignelater luminosus]|uniref:Uncharacterized protein n=1 Tax=Ignelater luminosus TaxID=2038154 RepID=A0A8K0G9P5_IGNLU|nr:hypothetical protein ILUMI_09393 [Ignelater luminosus]